MNALQHTQNCQKLVQLFVRTNWLIVVQELTNQQSFTLYQSIVAIRQCLRFLRLVLQYPEQCLVPNREIDAVVHILERNSLFNRYFEHHPGLGTRGEADRQQWLQAFQATRELFERHFGIGSISQAEAGSCQVVDYRFERHHRIGSAALPASCEVCLRIAQSPSVC